jgi:hypothetical protein
LILSTTFGTALKQLETGDAVAMQIERQGHLQYLSFEFE